MASYKTGPLGLNFGADGREGRPAMQEAFDVVEHSTMHGVEKRKLSTYVRSSRGPKNHWPLVSMSSTEETPLLVFIHI